MRKPVVNTNTIDVIYSDWSVRHVEDIEYIRHSLSIDLRQQRTLRLFFFFFYLFIPFLFSWQKFPFAIAIISPHSYRPRSNIVYLSPPSLSHANTIFHQPLTFTFLFTLVFSTFVVLSR